MKQIKEIFSKRSLKESLDLVTDKEFLLQVVLPLVIILAVVGLSLN
jgi:hypothetical protein